MILWFLSKISIAWAMLYLDAQKPRMSDEWLRKNIHQKNDSLND